MSQQEFYQEPQSQAYGQQPLSDNEIDTLSQPYYWSTKPPTRAVPKDEPLAHDAESMQHTDYAADYQRGYSAYNSGPHSSYQTAAPKADGPKAQSPSQRRFSPDGDAFENRYRPYASRNMQWRAPAWARPQRNHTGRWFWLIMLSLFFLPALLHVVGVLLAVIGVIFLTLIFPFVLVAVFALPYLFLRVVGRSHRRWRYTNYWRGPWGW